MEKNQKYLYLNQLEYDSDEERIKVSKIFNRIIAIGLTHMSATAISYSLRKASDEAIELNIKDIKSKKPIHSVGVKNKKVGTNSDLVPSGTKESALAKQEKRRQRNLNGL